MSSLDKIAPYPRSENEASAEAMARSYLSYAQLNYRLSIDHPDSDARQRATLAFVSYYSLGFVLRELEERAGSGQADQVARTLWEDLNAPQVLGPAVWEWLIEEYHVDVAAINEIAKRACKTNPGAGTQAGAAVTA